MRHYLTQKSEASGELPELVNGIAGMDGESFGGQSISVFSRKKEKAVNRVKSAQMFGGL